MASLGSFVPGGGWMPLLFWRIWKWVLRLITRRCELQRICSRENVLPDRTQAIAISLSHSKNKTLRTIATDITNSYSPEDAVAIVVRAKDIKTQDQPEFLLRLEPSLSQLISLNSVKYEVQRQVKERYSKDNTDHEKSLIKLWSLLVPQTQLQSRVTKQWGDIGFQGSDPATDFRGMGILGLHCLVYFAERYNDKARKVLGNSQHPSKGYPLAISGINMTSTLVGWLNSSVMDYYYYTLTQEREGITMVDFYDTYSFLMYSFNQFWFDSEPENVMEFPRLKESFGRDIELQLNHRPVRARLTLES